MGGALCEWASSLPYRLFFVHLALDLFHSFLHMQEHRLLLGQKDEFHLEAYVARAMRELKVFTLRTFG